MNEEQGKIEPIEKHGKQLIKSISEKQSLTLLKQTEIFEKLGNERIDETQDLSKQTNFNNLDYYFKGEGCPKKFINLKVH